MLKKTANYVRRCAAVCLIMAVALGAYIGYLQIYGNLHEVIAGQLYRSAQPSPSQIVDYADRYNIKSIINLRGDNEGKSWYDREIKTANALGIAHFDFKMSARRELSPERIAQLTRLMRDAPKPLLIHCKSGSDRTGLAAVIYLNQIAGVPEELAEGQLSIYFGHIGIPHLSRAYAMDASWEKFEVMTGLERLAAADAPL